VVDADPWALKSGAGALEHWEPRPLSQQ
jgi:hypothetical protein